MKIPTIALFVLAGAGLSPLHGEKAAEEVGYSSRLSHAALAKLMAAGKDPLAENSRAKNLPTESIEKKAKKNRGSLIGRSSILAYGGFWTLVPKGSILHVPPAYQSRLSSKPVGKLLTWADFYSRNRGWIYPQQVDLANARGETPFAEEVLENHKRLGRVVVAVLHQGPISVKAPKKPSPEATPSKQK